MSNWLLWQLLENKRWLPKLNLGRSCTADVRNIVSENNRSWKNMKNPSVLWHSQLENGGNYCELLYHEQTSQLLQTNEKPILCPSSLYIKGSDKFLIIHSQPFRIIMCEKQMASIAEHVKVGERQMGVLSPC